jgi:sulfane dehydrogenase subunit SoxC
MRFPSASRIHFIECGANSGMEWVSPRRFRCSSPTECSPCCEWTGVLVSILFRGDANAEAKLRVKQGSVGVWGSTPMPPNPQVKQHDLRKLVKWVLAQ